MDSAGKHHRSFSIAARASKSLLHAGEPELPGSIYKLLLKNVSRDDPLTNEEILVSTLQVELCRFNTQRPFVCRTGAERFPCYIDCRAMESLAAVCTGGKARNEET
jgi:hypothetical protein